MSSDQGKSWTKIGVKLPAESNHSAVRSSSTPKPSSSTPRAGSRRPHSGSTAARTRARLDFGYQPSGPLGSHSFTEDDVYWQRIWGGGLLKSSDQGKTWTEISKAIKSNPIELPQKRLAGLAGNQVLVSADAGVTWTKLGPPIGFKPNGYLQSTGPLLLCMGVVRQHEQETGLIVRLDRARAESFNHETKPIFNCASFCRFFDGFCRRCDRAI